MESLLEALMKIAPTIIGALLKLNPVVGIVGSVALVVAISKVAALAAKERWAKEKQQAGGKVGEQTSQDQRVAENVQDSLDDFLNGK